MKPRVTLGICVKNGAASLIDTLKSVQSQDFPHGLMEIIFVDDGSNDATLQIMKNYADISDTPTRIFSWKWQGLGASRQLVVEQASGEYIIWVDCDMILLKDHVSKQVEFMDANPKVGLAKARYGTADGSNVVAALENLPFMLHDFNGVPLDRNLPGTGGAIFRIDALRKIGGFDVNLKGTGEDQDVAYRVRHAGWLLERTSALFYERRVTNWSGLWKKWTWYGRGDYHLYSKNRRIFSPFRMNTFAGFVNGFLRMPGAYRKTHKPYVLLMPFHLAFTMSAWCAGFSWEKQHFRSNLKLA
jgi:glycosyltransferase involved in cell wall biosynthesis